MKKRTIFSALFFSTMLFAQNNSFADTYSIDPDHSNVGFKIRHLGISTVSGSFGEVSGTFNYDPKNVATSKTDAKIVVNSITTENKKRDDHLKSPEFFSADKFKDIVFESKEIQNIKPESFDVVGNLTMHGVTKQITLPVTFNGVAKDPYGNEKAAFSGTTKINRKDFGLQWNKTLETGSLLVGEEVTVSIDIEGTKKKA